MRRNGRRPQKVGAEFIDAGAPQLPQHTQALLGQDLKCARGAGLPGHGHAPQRRTPDQYGPGTQRKGLDDVAATHHAAVHEDLGAMPDTLDDVRKRKKRRDGCV